MYIVFDGDRQIGQPVPDIETAVATVDRLAQASPRSEGRGFYVTHVGAGDVYSTRSCGPEVCTACGRPLDATHFLTD